MGSSKIYATVAGFLAVAASSMTARSADLLPPPLMPEPFEVASVGGGWYLRGDVGVSKYEASKLSDRTVPGVSYYNEDYGSGAFAGGGIGYQFNNWFRADVTGEYRFSTGLNWRDRSSASTSYSFFNPGTGAYDNYSATGTSYENTKIGYSAAVVLANGYFDLGTWGGFTPFIGGGVGWAYHFMRGGETNTVNVFNTATRDIDGALAGGAPPSGVSGGTIRNRDHGDFAWALHAGVGYDVTPNVKLELAYRYLNMGDVRTGQVNCFCGTTYAGVKVRDLESHDIKLGMRWMFGETVPVEQPPLIRKY